MLISGGQRFKPDSYDNDKEKDFIGKTVKKVAQGKKKLINVGLDEIPHSARIFEDKEQMQAYISDRENKAEDKKTSQKHSRESLQDMTNVIMKQLTLIIHESNLYYYTGRSYKIIKDYEALLHIILSYVSSDAFGSLMIRQFQDLFIFLKASPKLIPENYDERMADSQYYISFRNGVLDIRTLELYRHSKEYLVFYELDADWTESRYPKEFIRFISQSSGGDKSVIIRMIEAIGYLLSVVNDGKYFFVMGTEHDSGKSTLAKLLQKIIGDSYIAHISTHQIGNRFALGDIHGKTLNISVDLPKGKLTPVVVSVIKQITGGDTITTDQKYEKMKNVHSNMRFLFGSNYPVTVAKDDDDESFWNRMIIIPFRHSVEKCDMDYELMEKMVEEKDEIISLCLKAFHKVLLRKCVFSECDVAEEMKRQWRGVKENSAYTLKKFIDECVEITGNPKDDVFAQDFYDAYSDYCYKRGWERMTYNEMSEWCDKNITDCQRKRIHHTGTNPRAGFTGMYLIGVREL